MIKALTKYLLLLCILLLTGYGKLAAHANSVLISTLTSEGHAVHLQAVGYTGQRNSTLIIKAKSGKRNILNVATEVEEEDNSLKKRADSFTSTTAIFLKQECAYFFGDEKKSPVSGYSFFASSHRYLMFNVFRI